MSLAGPTADRTTADRTTAEHDEIKSEDWPEEVNATHRSDLVQFNGDGLNTGVRVLGDGRLGIRINERIPSIAGILAPLAAPQLPAHVEKGEEKGEIDDNLRHGKHFPLKLNIVIQVIGSRGDIQPFVALGKELKAKGHRVRLATHLAFRDFVLEDGLEFFDIGGDPAELMAFMVKNPGLLPGLNTIRSGAIQKRRREMKQMMDGCWRSCFEIGDGTHLHQIKDDPWGDAVDFRRRPFVADAIIANPPSLAHIHCAQRLGIPLQIMFTMPWSPTQAFPHPLAILTRQDCKPTVANFVSYAVVDMMVWEGLGDLVNKFRKDSLSLDGLDYITAPSLTHRLKIPVSYLWSPAILPKPSDWGDNIDICGFSFLPSNSDYTPSAEIENFLKAGPIPIYVGFGSIVADNQVALTKTVFEAVKKSGQRAIISKGWGNLGADEVEVPDNILVIGSTPHDWLFRHVSCVIHHGGAGTTAAGLALACPTVIVPFFGDQQFWGEIVARAGAGPLPIPHKQLTVEKLSDAIDMALKPSTKERARELASKMEKESGVRDGVRSFHRHLNIDLLRCAICPSRPAVWHIKHTGIGISAFAAAVLVEMGKLQPENLVLHHSMEYDTYRDPAGPIMASAQVLFGAISYFVTELTNVPSEFVHEIVSAGRAMGNPSRQSNVRHQCHVRQRRNEEQMESDENSEENSTTRSDLPEQRMSSPPDSSISGADSMDGESLAIDRRGSLQLVKEPTMSSEIARSKPRGALSEAVIHGNRMSMKLVNLLIWLPTDLSLSLAKGFHNAPKLYNDPMVQSTPIVTGVRSGIRAAGKELRDSFYYGVTGLVTQPRYGFKNKGAKGMFKGVGKGLGGVILKPPAGLWGLAGYPLSGLRRQILDSLGKSQQSHIIFSRIAQGHEEIQASSIDERENVVRKWAVLEEQLQQIPRYRRSYSSSHTPHTNA